MANSPDSASEKDEAGRQKGQLFGIDRVTVPGTLPGKLEAPDDAVSSQIRVMTYDAETITEHQVATVEEIVALRGKDKVLWVDISGLSDIELIRALGEAFSLHRLALEDVVSVHQRPKAEDYGDYAFIVTRTLVPDTLTDTEQVSMFLGPDYLLTFQERHADCFHAVRKRLLDAAGRIRGSGADYLCYALIDSIIDGYFPKLELYGEKLEALEDDVVQKPDPAHIGELHDLKRNFLMIRRAVWPLRETINTLIRDDHAHFTESTRIYLRDCYDHAIQLIDIVETYREIANGLLDVYISSVSAKLNEVMKVLTIIATIFIPLGFVASLYGMNFDQDASPWNMPELRWKYGYPAVLLFMTAVGCGMLYYFWRMGWIGRGPKRRRRRYSDED
ncbi:MAG: magnesium/cobalt transporter CorA [Hyphomicrobiaceae bacterium]|nr:magnesium/cobalt transporter CorA [Hyphomicrobiaceae bacterium]